MKTTMGTVKIMVSILLFGYLASTVNAAPKGKSPFSFPLAGKTIVMGMDSKALLNLFPEGTKLASDDKKYSETVTVSFAADTVDFKFKQGKLVTVETSGGTEGLDPVVKEFSRWVYKKHGKGKMEENPPESTTTWNLANASIVENFSGNPETGDVSVFFILQAR